MDAADVDHIHIVVVSVVDEQLLDVSNKPPLPPLGIVDLLDEWELVGNMDEDDRSTCCVFIIVPELRVRSKD